MKSTLRIVSLLFLFVLKSVFFANAQQYTWAGNFGTSLQQYSGGYMSIRPNGTAETYAKVASAGLNYAVGGTNITSPVISGGSNVTAWDVNGNMVSEGAGTVTDIAYDPLNANVRYYAGYSWYQQPGSGATVANPTVNIGGWTFAIPNMPTANSAIKYFTWVVSQTRSGNTWTNNWVRFISAHNSNPTPFRGNDFLPSDPYSDFRTFSNVILRCGVVGGVTKLAFSVKSDGAVTTEDVSVYSNGSLVSGTTTNSTHRKLGSSLASITGSFYVITQFDGATGAPELLNTIVPNTAFVPGYAANLAYTNAGKLLIQPYMQLNTVNNTSFTYKNYTDTSGTPTATQALGGWTTAGNVPRYALIKTDAVTGAYEDGYIANLAHAAGNNTNFIPTELVVDGSNAYLMGVTLGTGNVTYDADGVGPLGAFTSNGRDMVLVKIPHAGAAGTMTPSGANRYGGAGTDGTINRFVGGSWNYTNSGQFKIDTTNGFLYFIYAASNSYTVGTATVGVNASGGANVILKVDTATLVAKDAISLIGTDGVAANKTNANNQISAFGIQGGRLYLTGHFFNTAEIRVNNSAIAKSLTFFNRSQPFVSKAGDAFFCTLDIATLGSPLPASSDLSNVYGRSSNAITKVVIRSDGNPIYLGTFQGNFSWDGTALGGTSGSFNSAPYNTDIIILADKTTGKVLDAVTSTDGSRVATFLDAKVNPYDGMLYVLYYGSGGIGKSAPTITSGIDRGDVAFITKIDPSNLNHVWTKVLANRRVIENDSANGGLQRANTYTAGIDFDPVTGDVFVVGTTGSEALYISTASITTTTTSATLNVRPSNAVGNPTTGYTLVAHTPGWAYNSSTAGTNAGGKVCNFFVKLNNAGVFQFGSTFGYNNNSVELSPKVAYMNGAVYIPITPSYAGDLVYNISGYTRASNLVNGPTVLTMPTAGRSALLKIDASTAALPSVTSTLGARPINVLKAVSNKNTNQLYLGGTLTGSGTFGGTAVTNSGEDILLWEINPATLSDAATGNARIGGSGYERLTGMTVDPSGKIYYAGYTNTPTAYNITTAGGTIPVPATNGSDDYIVGSVDPNGSYRPVFAFVSGSVNSDVCYDVTNGDLGTVFVGGTLKGTASFGTNGIIANTSGDLLFGRIDYPYLGPGGVNAGLDNWFDANYQAYLTGSTLDSLDNKNAPGNRNGNLPQLQATGSVAYNAPSAGTPNINFYPSVTLGGPNTLQKLNLGAGTFTSNGGAMIVFAVTKPSASGSKILNWQESTTGTSLDFSAGNVTRVSGTGSASASATTAPTPGKWTLSSFIYNGTSVTPNNTLSLYTNNKANGTATSTGTLNILNPGTFTVGGSSNAEVAEIATYNYPYSFTSTQYQRIVSFYGIKYGITLDKGLPYVNSSGLTLYDHRTTGTESAFANDVFGVLRDDAATLDQRQAVPADNSILSFGINNQIAATQSANTGALNNNDYILVGSSTAANNINSSMIGAVPPGIAVCAGFNIGKTWRAKVSLPYNSRSAAMKSLKLKFDLTQAGITAAQNANSNTAGSFYLMVDRNSNGVFSDAVDTLYLASNLTISSSGIDSLVEFSNVELDRDGNGSDQFALVWRTDGVEAGYYSTVGNTGNMINFCPNATTKYYRDPSATTKSYVVLDQNGNTSFTPSHISAQRMATPIDKSVTDTYGPFSARLMNYIVRVSATGTFTTNGGVKVRIYYDSVLLNQIRNYYSGPGSVNTWIKFNGGTGTEADLISAFNTNPRLTGQAVAVTPSSSGVSPNGIPWVEFITTSFSSFGYYSASTDLRVLPVELSRFSAKTINCQDVVLWSTTDEINLKKFIVQYSHNGVDFDDVAVVNAKGTNSDYKFTVNAGNETGYYRLKMVDNDGRFKLSEIARVDGCAKGKQVSILPNPVRSGDQLIVQLSGFNNAVVSSILSSSGKLVRQNLILKNGSNKISTMGIARGVYSLLITDTDGYNKVIKIVIQ